MAHLDEFEKKLQTKTNELFEMTSKGGELKTGWKKISLDESKQYLQEKSVTLPTSQHVSDYLHSPSKIRKGKTYAYKSKPKITWWKHKKSRRVLLQAHGILGKYENTDCKSTHPHIVTLEFTPKSNSPIKQTCCNTESNPCPYGRSVANPCTHVSCILTILSGSDDWVPKKFDFFIDVTKKTQERREKRKAEKALEKPKKKQKGKGKKSSAKRKTSVAKRKNKKKIKK